MNYNEYQKGCRMTAIYPGYAATVYPVLGLVDEIGELHEKIVNGAEREEIVKECGDVTWYAAIVADDCGIQFAHVTDDASCGESFPDPSMLYLPAARVAGIIKKSIRDNNGFVTIDARNAIMVNLATVVSGINAIAPLEEVCSKNLDKLRSRAERGVISGNGDNR